MKITRRHPAKRNAPRLASTERIWTSYAVAKIIIHARPVNHATCDRCQHVSEILPGVLVQLMANATRKERR